MEYAMELMDKDALKKGIESWGKRGNSLSLIHI